MKTYSAPIDRRTVSNLSVGDVLKRIHDNTFYEILDIDFSLTTTNTFFHFQGFTVKSNNLLRGMFKSDPEGTLYVYDSKMTKIYRRFLDDTEHGKQ